MAEFDSAPESLQLRARIQQHLAAAQDARLAARAGDHEALEDAAYHDNQVALLREKLRRMGYCPNPTDRRLFKSLSVFSKFPPEEREGLRLSLIEIVFNSIGIDHYDRRATSAELLEEYGTDARLTGKSVIDGCVPWLARRLAKERFADQREADATLDALKRGFRKLCTWATETRQNLDSYSLLDALEESQGYQSFAQRKGKEESDVNPTLYRFADGWKVVELRTEKALEREGDLMNHCVGGYCEQVESGESRIFSLRDPDNKPHVTMEYSPEEKRFAQIYGPSNKKPEEYTRPYLIEFIEEEFAENFLALLKAGVPAKELGLRYADLRGKHFPDVADLRGVDFRDTDLRGADLYTALLEKADLRKAKLQGADLHNARLHGAKLQGAKLQKANLGRAVLQDAKLQRAELQGANLEYATLRGVYLRGALYDDETFWPYGFDPDVAGAINVDED